MRHPILILIVFASVLASCATPKQTIPPSQQKVLADVSRFHESYSTTNLPPAVVALCADQNGRFAEPGQAWEATDNIIDESLPRCRLIWAATDGDYYVVHYERGGIVHTTDLLIVTMRPEAKEPTSIFHHYTHQLKDYKAFVREMKAGRLTD